MISTKNDINSNTNRGISEVNVVCLFFVDVNPGK